MDKNKTMTPSTTNQDWEELKNQYLAVLHAPSVSDQVDTEYLWGWIKRKIELSLEFGLLALEQQREEIENLIKQPDNVSGIGKASLTSGTWIHQEDLLFKLAQLRVKEKEESKI